MAYNINNIFILSVGNKRSSHTTPLNCSSTIQINLKTQTKSWSFILTYFTVCAAIFVRTLAQIWSVSYQIHTRASVLTWCRQHALVTL